MEQKLEDIDVKVEGMGLKSPEEIRAMIQASIESEHVDNPNARIQLLEMDELPGYLENHQDEGRTQLIIYKGNHYMAADILVQNNVKSCILLDAANDPRYLAAEDYFKEAGYNTYTACGFSFSTNNLQSDVYSCPLFAFDHSVQFSYTADSIHNEIKEKSDNTVSSFFWDDLPPNFLWNVQSMSTRDEYVMHYPEQAQMPMHNQISFNAYIDQGLVTDSKGKQRNNSINIHVFDTIESTYMRKQRSQNLLHMDLKLDELMGKTHNNEQISSLCAIRDELSRSTDLSRNQELMQQFSAQANPQKISMFRSAMQLLRGKGQQAEQVMQSGSKQAPIQHNENTASKQKIRR